MNDVAQWLQSIGLGEYVGVFAENDIEWSTLPALDHALLKEIGVVSVGHRVVLLEAIEKISDPSGVTTSIPPAAFAGHDGAERRQLTVMFCDLVGSTALSQSMDPEELRDVIAAYQRTATASIEHYGGYVARFMGDGLLVYFGYPQAHEDDAERAVRAALVVSEEVSGLELSAGSALQVRIGISTGLVVVGDLVGKGASEERAALGDTPNLAARLQGIAPPGATVVSETTQALVHGLFELDPLGPLALKGIASPTNAYRVIGPGSAPNRFEAAAALGLTPLVGRDAELDLLHTRWEQALAGEAQLFRVAGEPGVGKSRLIRAFRDLAEPSVRYRAYLFCSVHHQRSVLWPVREQLQRDSGFVRGDPDEARHARLERFLGDLGLPVHEHGPVLRDLLGIGADRPSSLSELAPAEVRRRIFRSLGALFEAMAEKGPLLIVVEDAHWVDASTEELLGQLMARMRSLPMFLVVTHRPEYTPPWSELSTALTLGRLSRRECMDLVSEVVGSDVLPSELVEQIVARTDGIPLFAEELTRAVLDASRARDDEGHGDDVVPASSPGIPSSLQDSLTARIDGLGAAKEVAQTAAVIGRRFDYPLLERVTPLTGSRLADALERMVEVGLIYRPDPTIDTTYEFKHALIQEAAYQTLLRAKRRRLHADVGEALENHYPDLVETEPELLAHHFSEATAAEKAVDYWQRAGQLAVARSANREAEGHLRRGLQALEALPASPERQRRFAALQNALGVSMMPTRGFGNTEVAGAFAAAAGASESLDDERGLYIALRGLGQYLMISGKLREATSHVDRVMTLARGLDDTGALLEAHHLGWITLSFAGDYRAAREHANVGIATYEPERDHALTHTYSGHDPGVCCRAFGALPMWQLGYPEQAARMVRDGESLAAELGHPFSIVVALWARTMLQQLLGEVDATRQSSELLIEQSGEGGFALMSTLGHIYRAWADATGGVLDEGIAGMRQGVDQLLRDGTEFGLPALYAQVAELHGRAGDVQSGLAAVEEGTSIARKNGDFFNWPELQRVRAKLLLHASSDNAEAAEASLESAIAAARQQEARLLELRAAVDLAAIRAGRGQRPQALALLSSRYSQLSEGFDSADLRQAKSLLDQLS